MDRRINVRIIGDEYFPSRFNPREIEIDGKSDFTSQAAYLFGTEYSQLSFSPLSLSLSLSPFLKFFLSFTLKNSTLFNNFRISLFFPRCCVTFFL